MKADLPVGIMLQDHLQYHLYYSINTSLNIDSDDKKDPGEILNYILQKKGREDNNDKFKKKHKQKYHTVGTVLKLCRKFIE